MYKFNYISESRAAVICINEIIQNVDLYNIYQSHSKYIITKFIFVP